MGTQASVWLRCQKGFDQCSQAAVGIPRSRGSSQLPEQIWAPEDREDQACCVVLWTLPTTISPQTPANSVGSGVPNAQASGRTAPF